MILCPCFLYVYMSHAHTHTEYSPVRACHGRKLCGGKAGSLHSVLRVEGIQRHNNNIAVLILSSNTRWELMGIYAYPQVVSSCCCCNIALWKCKQFFRIHLSTVISKSTIHSLNKHQWSASCVPDTAPNAGEKAQNKTNKYRSFQ